MNFSRHDFVTVNEILADALKLVGDVEMKHHNKGWYTSQIQQALEELSFDTFFLDVEKHLTIPEDLRLDIPKGSFNIQQMYAYNGDRCTIESRVNVYHKKNFVNGIGGGEQYFARDNYSNNQDRFHKGRSTHKTVPDNVYFYNIQGGIIMLSSNLSSFDKLMIVSNGVHTDIGDVPVVPIYLRQAVKTKIVVDAIEGRMGSAIGTPEYNQLFNLHAVHSNKLNHPYDGLWVEAQRRVKGIDRKQKQDMKEYFQAMNY